MMKQPFSSKDYLKKCFWKNIHFGRVVVWCYVKQRIIHFSESSILPSVRSSIHPYHLQVILVLNLQCGTELNKFRPPNSSDDLCLLFCLLYFFYAWFSSMLLSQAAQLEFQPTQTQFSIKLILKKYKKSKIKTNIGKKLLILFKDGS